MMIISKDSCMEVCVERDGVRKPLFLSRPTFTKMMFSNSNEYYGEMKYLFDKAIKNYLNLIVFDKQKIKALKKKIKQIKINRRCKVSYLEDSDICFEENMQKFYIDRSPLLEYVFEVYKSTELENLFDIMLNTYCDYTFGRRYTRIPLEPDEDLKVTLIRHIEE